MSNSRVTVTTAIRIDGQCDDLEALASAVEPRLVQIYAKESGRGFRYYVQPRPQSLSIGLNFLRPSSDGYWERATDASLKATQEALNEMGDEGVTARIWSRGIAGL